MMNWYELAMGLLGVIGGGAGFISIYQAKSNKQTIDISNLSSIIKEEREERESLRKEYDAYKESVDERIRMFKVEFEKMKKNNVKYLKAVYQAYRCKFPQNVCDCPVIKAIETSGVCDACDDVNKQV